MMNVIVVGSGFAGITFSEKLRTLNSDIRITLITRESDGFYSRPLLSHGFSKEGIERSIILKTFDAIRQNGIDIISASEVETIDRHNKALKLKGDSNVRTLEYDRLVLALGSAAFIPPHLSKDREHFHTFNSLADLVTLRRLRQSLLDRNITPHWAIIGGGLIGCEVASDLAAVGDKVSLFHAMERLMERQLDDEDSQKLQKVLQHNNIEILLKQNVTGITKNRDEIVVNAEKSGKFDAVIVACGFKPRTELAASAHLTVNRGIKVNSFLQTDDPDIFALGDVAELPDGKLYPFILPIRSQAQWLAEFIIDEDIQPWNAPDFKPKSKVHGFTADNPKFF